LRVGHGGRAVDDRIESVPELDSVQLLEVDLPAPVDDDAAHEDALASGPVVPNDIEMVIHRPLLATPSKGSRNSDDVPKHEAEPRCWVGHRQDDHIPEELPLTIFRSPAAVEYFRSTLGSVASPVQNGPIEGPSARRVVARMTPRMHSRRQPRSERP
jgi:hypothetical protein